MSGPFGASQWMYNAGSDFYPHSIDQSLRFDKASSPVLHRTPSSSSNRKTWSFSCWIKLSSLHTTAINNSIFSAGSNVFNRRVDISIGSGNRLMFFMDGRVDGASYYSFIADRLLRDTSAWMHIMAVMDTTNSTADDRLKIYINGERQSGAYQYGHGAPPLNSDWYINSTYQHDIGDGHHNTVVQFFDGYIAEVHHVDGSALTPSSFGETKDGVWIPQEYSGSHGTNGFYLPFDDSSAIGDDESANNNDFTAINLAAHDVVPDSPTNNFAVLNALDNATALSEGSLAQTGNANWRASRSTFKLPASGKWYFEATTTVNSQRIILGVAVDSMSLTSSAQVLTGFVGMAIDSTNANAQNNQSSSTNLFVNTGSSGRLMLVQMAVDCDTGKMWFGYNGDFYNSSGDATGNPSAGTNETVTLSAPKNFFPLVQSYDNNNKIVANFGQDSSFAGNRTSGSAGASDANGQGDFFYAPPSDFLALCSANLPEPEIIDGSEYFNTVLYTGNGGTQSITGVGFQPDWVWMKSRDEGSSSYTGHHVVQDSVRGVGTDTALVTNENYSEAGTGYSNALTAFNSDGFTLGARNQVNYNNDAFVSWNWLANTAFSNDASATGVGTIDSSGSVSVKSGFSIISYVANGTNTGTVAHGLATEPTMVIQKERSASSDWLVYTDFVDGSDDYLLLNSTAGKGNAAGGATATVFNSWDRTSGNNMIAYCFADIEGYCKAGSYSGNSSADGTYVHLGFCPAWLMVKSTSSGTQWMIYDNKRLGYNVDNNALTADDNATEKTDNDVDLLSNGFKWRRSSPNFNQSSYIYLAFGSSPAKYSNAR